MCSSDLKTKISFVVLSPAPSLALSFRYAVLDPGLYTAISTKARSALRAVPLVESIKSLEFKSVQSVDALPDVLLHAICSPV